jgi:hypothetical protein
MFGWGVLLIERTSKLAQSEDLDTKSMLLSVRFPHRIDAMHHGVRSTHRWQAKGMNWSLLYNNVRGIEAASELALHYSVLSLPLGFFFLEVRAHICKSPTVVRSYPIRVSPIGQSQLQRKTNNTE